MLMKRLLFVAVAVVAAHMAVAAPVEWYESTDGDFFV